MEQEMRIAAEIQQALLPKAGRSGVVLHAPPRRRCRADRSAATSTTTSICRTARSASRSATWRARVRPAALLSAMMQGIFAAQAASSDPPSQTDQPREPGALPPRHRVAVRDADVRRARPGRPADVLQRRPQPAARRRARAASAGSRAAARSSGCSRARPSRRKRSSLDAGDWLIVFSDGVSEALSADGEEYGEARILTVRPEELRHGAAGAARGALRRRPRVHDAAPPRATTSPRWCCYGSADAADAARSAVALAILWRPRWRRRLERHLRRAGRARHQGIPVPARAAARRASAPAIAARAAAMDDDRPARRGSSACSGRRVILLAGRGSPIRTWSAARRRAMSHRYASR